MSRLALAARVGRSSAEALHVALAGWLAEQGVPHLTLREKDRPDRRLTARETDLPGLLREAGDAEIVGFDGALVIVIQGCQASVHTTDPRLAERARSLAR